MSGPEGPLPRGGTPPGRFASERDTMAAETSAHEARHGGCRSAATGGCLLGLGGVLLAILAVMTVIVVLVRLALLAWSYL